MFIIKFPSLSFSLFNRWQFVPGMYSSVITLLLFPLFVYLGCWQWDRAAQKKQILILQNTYQQQKPILWDNQYMISANQTVFNPLHPMFLQHFTIPGQFLSNTQILLDNKTHEGIVGFQIFALFKPLGSQQFILIDRGFISRQNYQQCSNLEAIFKNTETQEITGMIIFPKKGFQLNSQHLLEKLNEQHVLAQQIDYSKLSHYLNLPLAQFTIKLDPNSPFVLTFIPLQVGLPAAKHLGYALQWFIMSLTVLLYYLVINTHRSKTVSR